MYFLCEKIEDCLCLSTTAHLSIFAMFSNIPDGQQLTMGCLGGITFRYKDGRISFNVASPSPRVNISPEHLANYYKKYVSKDFLTKDEESLWDRLRMADGLHKGATMRDMETLRKDEPPLSPLALAHATVKRLEGSPFAEEDAEELARNRRRDKRLLRRFQLDLELALGGILSVKMRLEAASQAAEKAATELASAKELIAKSVV